MHVTKYGSACQRARDVSLMSCQLCLVARGSPPDAGTEASSCVLRMHVLLLETCCLAVAALLRAWQALTVSSCSARMSGLQRVGQRH